MTDAALEAVLEKRIAALGYELVELERAGSRVRPILRVRIDLPGSAPGQGVTVADCARVSRALEAMLDADATVGGSYVLEVSSPGVERPLVRSRDFDRFAGQEIAVKIKEELAGHGRRLEGQLLGRAGPEPGDRVRLRLPDGQIVEVPRADIVRAHLVFRWRG